MASEQFDAVLAEIVAGLKDAADDYRMVIPQFHAQNRKRMKALASTMDDAIAAFDRLAAAHAAEAREARDWNERVSVCRDHTADIVDGDCVVCALAERDARIAALEEALDGKRHESNAAWVAAEAAERDARRAVGLLRECRPYVSSMAQASHLTDGFSPKPANEHDRLAERIDACIGGGEGK